MSLTSMMIKKTYQCRQCGSSDLIKNGHNASGSQQYHCKACGAYLVLEPNKGYSDEEKEHILRAYRERGSMRAAERIFGVSRNTLSRWLKKGTPASRAERSLAPGRGRRRARTR